MTVAKTRKKLIEVSVPLEAINKASAREKSIRHGHPSTLHLWWARRPLAACRAVLFAQLVDDPSSWPEKFDHDEEKIEAERRRLHKVIEEMVEWPGSTDAEKERFECAIEAARWEIARSVAWGLGEEPPAKGDGKTILAYLQEKAPPVYDPFSGGGSIPLEAQRLGLRSYGSDLNPVAVLIGKALVEIPPKFAGMPPVNPRSQTELKRGGEWNGKGAQGLAEDVRYYGQAMRDEAAKRIGHLYPKAKLEDGTEATVIAWLWARTVRSPDPVAKGAMVPLMSSFMLSTKEGKKAWVKPVIDAAALEGWRFELRRGELSKEREAELKNGTKAGKGEAFRCILTGSPIERSYIQREGKNGNIGATLIAVVAEGHRQKVFAEAAAQPATRLADDQKDLVEDARQSFLSGALPDRSMITGGVCSAYGFTTWGDLFTDRQILALTTFSDLIREVSERVKADCLSSAILAPRSQEYAKAVATYLACAVGRAADFWTSQATWLDGLEAVCHAFTRQGLPMVWDFVEANPFSAASGNWDNTSLEWVPKVVDRLPASSPASISLRDAKRVATAKVAYSFDPPYYDNISYAVLADYFYNWLRRSLEFSYPDLTRRLATPKEEELVVMRNRHKNREEAEEYFLSGMSEVFHNVAAGQQENYPLTLYYAFKQSEVAKDGVTSAGWASFLQAIVEAGLGVDGTWPIRTERAARTVGIGANALASSIVLVCRKRAKTAASIDRAGLTAALRRELPDAIAKIRAAGVGPVDMQQSVIGPGMGVFTRFSEVLEDDDSVMPVKTALSIINRVWEEIDNEIVASFDAETQVALAWFASYGFDTRTSGELITLANAKNTTTDELFKSDVFVDLRGKAALKPRESLDPNWSPRTDRRPTVWECVQHTAHALDLKNEQGGAQVAARLISEMGSTATDARALLDRLFQIATDKGWAAEALVYNQLAEEWPHLQDRAANMSEELKPAVTGDLFA